MEEMGKDVFLTEGRDNPFAPVVKIEKLIETLQQLANHSLARAPSAFVPSYDARIDALPLAKKLVAERTTRAKFFDSGILGEAAWDILLDLYICGCEHRMVSVSSACIASRVPSTTAFRCITWLTDDGIIIRLPDPNDKRRIHLSLAPHMEVKMTAYLEALAPKR
jgi:DNA-binding MarR family transcriptional regulator